MKQTNNLGATMVNSEELRQEASISSQTRVDIRRLATMTNYFEGSGHRVRNISQLIADSIEMLCNILRANAAFDKEFNSVTEANNYLYTLGLRQASMDKKNFKKIGAAVRFESMREEGIDPKIYVPQQYNVLHNKNSVQPGNVEVVAGGVSAYEEEWTKVKLMKQREEFEAKKKTREEGLAAARQMGTLVENKIPDLREGISDEELIERNRLREVEVNKLENAPLDMEFLKSLVVKPPKDE
jgi:hypothetical protein